MVSVKSGKNIIILIIIVVFSLSCANKKLVESGFVTFYYGDVKIKSSGTLFSTVPKLKMVVKAGDTIYTKENSRIDVQLQGFGLIRINQNSQVDLDKVITQANESIKLGLNNGQILCKILALRKGQDFKVETPTAVAGVRGTTFLVEAQKENKASEVAVESGAVEVADKKEPEKKVVVQPNETAKVDTKTKILEKMKGIDTKKLQEFKALKDVAVLKDVKNMKLDALKKMSFKNLKSLNIKDIKGLGSEFQSLMPGSKEPEKDASQTNKTLQKAEDMKAKIDTEKEKLEDKQNELEAQKQKAVDSAKDAQEKLKKNLKGLKF